MVSFSKSDDLMSQNIVQTPVVSVIVPVYNSSKYLSECLDSILGQTFTDIEVICIDDGSTDNSLSILNNYAQMDSRVLVLKQENKGGGGARNLGITKARGKYVLFLDSDDFFDRNYFEIMYSTAENCGSDITVCEYYLYDNKTGDISVPLNITELQTPEKTTFSYLDVKDTIFHTVPLVVWNRLYRREFIIDSGLRFQEIFHFNDIYFCHLSLIIAKSISLVPHPLVYYRVNQSTNTQSKTYTAPYDFAHTISAVRDKLLELNVFSDVENSFIHYALDTSLYIEKKLRGYDCHSEIHNSLVTRLFDDYGISNHPPSYYYNKYKYFEYLVVSQSHADSLRKNSVSCHVKTALAHPISFGKACIHLLKCTIRLVKITGFKSCVNTIVKYF